MAVQHNHKEDNYRIVLPLSGLNDATLKAGIKAIHYHRRCAPIKLLKLSMSVSLGTIVINDVTHCYSHLFISSSAHPSTEYTSLRCSSLPITSQQQSCQEAIRMNRASSTAEGKKVDGNINGVGMQGKQKSNRKCVYKGLGINQITRHASNHINSVVGGNMGVLLWGAINSEIESIFGRLRD